MTFKMPEAIISFSKCPNKVFISLNTSTDAEKEEDKGQYELFEIISGINHK